jgi:hydroxymethylglutaryl-CoA lyase
MPAHSKKIKIVEVGPRDGLQNEKVMVATATKVQLIHRLIHEARVQFIEATAFVSPKWVPQMADAAQVLAQIDRVPGVTYSVLTPNAQGFQAALQAQVSEVAIFGSASESFSQRNINCSISQALDRFEQVMALAKTAQLPVRG